MPSELLGIFLFLAQRKIILIFAPEIIAKLYQNKKIGGDEAIFSPSKESNPQHTWAYVRNLTTEDWWKKSPSERFEPKEI